MIQTRSRKKRQSLLRTGGRIIALEETVCKKVSACSKERDSPSVRIAANRVLHEVGEQGRTASCKQGLIIHDKAFGF